MNKEQIKELTKQVEELRQEVADLKRHYVKILWRDDAGYVHYCEGCDETHVIPHSWDFNGDMEAPTFSPSIRHLCKYGVDDKADKICHYAINHGKIEYCGDCTHDLAGKVLFLYPYDFSGWKEFYHA